MKTENLKTEYERFLALNNSGDYTAAEALATKMLADPATAQEPEFRAKIMINLSSLIRYYLHRPKDALSVIKEAQLITEHIADKELMAKAYNETGQVNMHLSDYSTAQEYFQKSLYLFEELGNRREIANTYKSIGVVNFHTSDYWDALENFQHALLLEEEIGDNKAIVRTIGNIGIAYMELAEYAKALEQFEKSMRLGKEIGEKRVCANATGNISLVYQYLNNEDKTLEYSKKALNLLEELNDKMGVAAMYSNIGSIHSNSDNKLALEYFRKARDVYEELGHRAFVSRADMDIGDMLSRNHEYAETVEHFIKAEAVFEELGLKTDMALLLLQLAKLFSNRKFDGYNAQKAEEYFHKGLKLSEELGIKKQNYEAHKYLSDFYEQQGKVKEAIEHYKKYHQIYVEVQSEEATKHGMQMENRRKVEEAERDRQVKLARFQEQEKILLNILPEQIAERILEGEKRIADMHEHVSVFFSDIVGFTKLSQTITPDELLTMLNEIFSEFDRIARKHGLEKIKTIGDAYMAVAGVPLAQEDHAQRAANFALEVIEYMKSYRKKSNSDLQIRVGLHCGKAIAGVIGENKFAYDLWGDSVNTASRMESHGEAGRIHVSEDFRNALSESNLHFMERGEMEVKGKGKMKTYFLEKES